jgi:hypothetical protein
MLTVRDFITQSYRLVSAASPTVPLHGSDLSLGLQVLNQLLQSYASTGLMLTISREYSLPLSVGQENVICGPADFVPTPDVPIGRLANLENAWLLLNGVTYPLIIEARSEFLAAWKFDPLKSLPRFVMVFPETQVTRLRLYPAPSQFFELFLRGKFQLNTLTANDDMSSVPQYYQRYLMFALARDVAMYKGRMEAWTPQLEAMYQAAKDEMVSSSEVNLAITGERDSLLNGAWAVRAGVS